MLKFQHLLLTLHRFRWLWTVAFLAVAVLLFRWFAPEHAFPVTWKRGVAAHLDVTGARGDAIRRAVGNQLGVEVSALRPVGLEGSAGWWLSGFHPPTSLARSRSIMSADCGAA